MVRRTWTGIMSIWIVGCLLSACESGKPDPLQKSGSNLPVDTNYIGPHYPHHVLQAHSNPGSEEKWDDIIAKPPIDPNISIPEGATLGDQKLFGWHMYKHGTAYKEYPWSMLWGVAYFGYMIDPTDGGYRDIYQWRTTGLVDSAKRHGVEVYLTAGLYGEKDIVAFLNNRSAIQNFITTITDELQQRDATGINIDFEGIPSNQTAQLVSFISEVSKNFRALEKPLKVSLSLYAIDWHRVFKISELAPHVDWFALMAYDYYGGFSKNTGPVSPTRSTNLFGQYSMENSMEYYMQQGVQKQKMIVCLPLYGIIWTTQNEDVPGAILEFDRHIPLGEFEHDFLDSLGHRMKLIETSDNTYLIVKGQDGKVDQYWVDDVNVLGSKLKMIRDAQMGGVGFWSLGYAHGADSLWHMVYDQLTIKN